MDRKADSADLEALAPSPAAPALVPSATAVSAAGAVYDRVLARARGRCAVIAPADILQLQRAAGNRAVLSALGRALQRAPDPRPEGTPGNRPALVAGDTGPGVTLLQSLLIRYVSSENAISLKQSGVADPDTMAMLRLFGEQYGTGSSVGQVWATLDELEKARGQATPTGPKTESFDDLSDTHNADVAAIVNRHMDLSYDRSHRPGSTSLDLREHVIRARDTVSNERNAPGNLTLNITLRDAQRYLYGRLAPYTDPAKLGDWGESGGANYEVFHNDPSNSNLRGAIRKAEEYETIKKSGKDVRTTDKPASAAGGVPYFNKGIADSDKDTVDDRWKKDLRPDHMDTTGIGGCPPEGHGAFPCGGAAGSEEA